MTLRKPYWLAPALFVVALPIFHLVADDPKESRTNFTHDKGGPAFRGIVMKPEGKGPFPAILASHGKGGNADAFSRAKAVEFVKMGYVCIIPDYTHADAKVDRKEAGASVENIRRAKVCIDMLQAMPDVDGKRIYAFGHSMGAFLTIGLAAEESRIVAAAITAGGLAPKPGFPAPSSEVAAKIKTPMIIFHGTADETVPPERSKMLAEVLKENKVEHERHLIEGAGHDVFKPNGQDIYRKVDAWFKKFAKAETGKTHDVRLNGHVFTLPVGFTIELVAGPPLVDRPITADFDEEGRLYVSDSSGSNEKVAIQLEKKPHRIVRLESTKDNGVFDKATVFADKMMFPEGTMWHAGSLYVAAPPSIWKLTDTNNDGVADERIEWFQGKTLTGCANDLHGPYLGPDGWIYWGKGAFAPQTYERPGKGPWKTRASHIFRARVDGTGVEPVMTGGMDNAIDVCFTPGGERILSNTFIQFPGGGKRDGLLHAVYGGVYGKDWDPIYEHPWTGPSVMPVLSHLGPSAACGMTRMESDAFGPEYQDNLFTCLFNMRKIVRTVLTPDGATFKSHDEDFLVSNHLDFHPTDVIEDADGSLIVVDTGGWYKLCCPTSQLVKPDVLGAIYRVRRIDAPKVDDPRGRKIFWSTIPNRDVATRLQDNRPFVRRRAIEVLAERKAVEALLQADRFGESPQVRRDAVWALTRIEGVDARAAVRRALLDRDETVRQAAAHSASVWRDRESVKGLLRMLRSTSPHNRRVAAEALGRIGDPQTVIDLLAALAADNDRFLEHSLIYALIEIGDPVGTSAGLNHIDRRATRGALIALDQMEGGKLDPKVVAGFLDAPDARLRETASWIVGRHPEWGTALAADFRKRIASNALPPDEAKDMMLHLGRLSRSPAIQELLADCLGDGSTRQMKSFALGAMAKSNLKQMPKSWATGIANVLQFEQAIAHDAVAAARAVPLPKPAPPDLVQALSRLYENHRIPTEDALAALAALPDGLAEVPKGMWPWLLECLGREEPAARRALAADVIARAKLSPAQLNELTDAFKTIGPLEINRVLDAFQSSRDEKLGLRLVDALQASPSFMAVRPDRLRTLLAKFGPPLHEPADKILGRLDTGAAAQKAKLEKLIADLAPGDVRRGQAVFNSAKAACVSCHSVGYVGGKVGPDLTRIGSVRSARDLLESIVFPSASIVQGYEPVTITTTDGRVVNGLVRGNNEDGVTLAANATVEVRVPRAEIAEMLPSRVSVMPSGLDQQISAQELADLIAFLQACR